MRPVVRTVPAGLVAPACLILAAAAHAFEPPEPEDLKSPEDLRYFTEQYPPYNYKADGRLQGLMIDTWEALWDRMGADLDREDITHAPWARGYHELQMWPGTALAVMTYTEDRAEYMKFIGPLVDVRFVLFARKDAGIEIRHISDATGHTIGTVRDDIAEQLLVDEGLSLDDFERLEGPAQAAELLAAGRIDLWSYQEDVALFEMAQAGLDPDAYEAVYVTDRGTLMAAFHIATPQELIDEFQDALDAMKADGTMATVIERHLER